MVVGLVVVVVIRHRCCCCWQHVVVVVVVVTGGGVGVGGGCLHPLPTPSKKEFDTLGYDSQRREDCAEHL